MNTILTCLMIGVGATLLMDIWGILRGPLFGVAPADYRLLGRWLGHMKRGRFCHPAIAEASAVRGERLIGWSAHYAIGIAFAALLVVLAGEPWLQAPTPWLALQLGLITVAAPFLLMQPAMGAGIAASRTAQPNCVRLQSLITHLVFGLGLYLSALALHLLS